MSYLKLWISNSKRITNVPVLLCIRTAVITRGNGVGGSDGALARWSGRMVPRIKATGRWAMPGEGAFLLIVSVINMTESSK